MISDFKYKCFIEVLSICISLSIILIINFKYKAKLHNITSTHDIIIHWWINCCALLKILIWINLIILSNLTILTKLLLWLLCKSLTNVILRLNVLTNLHLRYLWSLIGLPWLSLLFPILYNFIYGFFLGNHFRHLILQLILALKFLNLVKSLTASCFIRIEIQCHTYICMNSLF